MTSSMWVSRRSRGQSRPPGHAARNSQSPSTPSPAPSLRVKNTPEVCLRAHVQALRRSF